MSETGATAEQLYRVCPACHGSGEKHSAFESEWDATCLTCEGEGYQIVPAGAVVLTAEEAAVAADGCDTAARMLTSKNESTTWLPQSNVDALNRRAARYSALAAKLGGDK